MLEVKPSLFLTVGGEQEMCCILLRQPSDLVDFLLYLQTLQVVEVRLVALERAVDIVLPRVPRLPCLLWLVFRLETVKKTQVSAEVKFRYVIETERSEGNLTSVSLWKMTTRPPLSPVASRSPVWLNSTVEMTSAGRERGKYEAVVQINKCSLRWRNEQRSQSAWMWTQGLDPAQCFVQRSSVLSATNTSILV